MKRELNLLPTQRQKLLSRESLIENIAAALGSFNVLLFTIAISGVAVIFILQAFTFITSATASEQLEQEVERYSGLRQQIAEQNITIESMQKLENERIVWSSLIPDALTAMSPGTSIAVMSGRATTRSISINGNTTSRGAVVAIRQRLSDLPWTANVQAPSTNLIERVNPDFSFDLQIAGTEAGL